jgi:abhydrolase domain-containing protein 12
MDWAVNEADIRPEQIVIFGQSLGSAVAVALAHELSKRDTPVDFAGLVITASFTDVAQLTATYRLGGVIPALSPSAKLTPLFNFFTRRLHSTWDNMWRLGEFVENAERYHVTLIHAEDDRDIPMEHSIRLFRETARVSERGREPVADLDVGFLDRLEEKKASLGEGGSTTVWATPKGEIRLELVKYGVHDMITSYCVTGLAVSHACKEAGL